MIHIMANENTDEWSNNAAVTTETIRAVVTAFAADKFELPAVRRSARQIRKAPRFVVVAQSVGEELTAPQRRDEFFYTAGTLVLFLGWSRLSN